MKPLNSSLQSFVQSLNKKPDPSRLAVLHTIIDYCKSSISAHNEVRLNFICTHNSRRSQFSQVWAQVAAYVYDVPAVCYSGGVEVTAFNERAVASLERVGFNVSSEGTENPTYSISYAENGQPITTFSKLFDDPSSPKTHFAAVMTCSDADENCPFIPGAEKRIPLRYEDPKKFDDSPLESAKYDERSAQIASELFYIFSQVND